MKLKVEGEADGQPKAASTHYRSIARFLFVQASACIVECSTDFKARFHVAVRTQINKFVFYFIVRRNVKSGCSEC